MAKITLTIDNGPDPELTPQVLAVLKQTRVTAHFFVVGRRIARPGGFALLDEIQRDGHVIGNHTWSHATPFGDNSDPCAVADEVERTSKLLSGYLSKPPLFRPFGGGGRLDRCLFSPALIEHLVTTGFTAVLWNVVPRDWEDLDGWVDTALTQVGERDWSVVVVHDNLPGNAVRIGEFIERARARGHAFVAGIAPECLPIVGGELRADLSDYTSTAKTA
jgi:peptidoglycan/xylan/chitin deacetylase (PgdA/CDA1 family)